MGTILSYGVCRVWICAAMNDKVLLQFRLGQGIEGRGLQVRKRRTWRSCQKKKNTRKTSSRNKQIFFFTFLLINILKKLEFPVHTRIYQVNVVCVHKQPIEGNQPLFPLCTDQTEERRVKKNERILLYSLTLVKIRCLHQMSASKCKPVRQPV